MEEPAVDVWAVVASVSRLKLRAQRRGRGARRQASPADCPSPLRVDLTPTHHHPPPTQPATDCPQVVVSFHQLEQRQHRLEHSGQKTEPRPTETGGRGSAAAPNQKPAESGARKLVIPRLRKAATIQLPDVGSSQPDNVAERGLRSHVAGVSADLDCLLRHLDALSAASSRHSRSRRPKLPPALPLCDPSRDY